MYELDLEISSFLKLLGVTFDTKIHFEKHICNIASVLPKQLALFKKIIKRLAMMVLYSTMNPYVWCLMLCSWFQFKAVWSCIYNIRFFIHSFLINIEKRINLVFLCFIKFYAILIINFFVNLDILQIQFALLITQPKKSIKFLYWPSIIPINSLNVLRVLNSEIVCPMNMF